MADQVTVIPTVRQVYSDTYSNLPTTGLNNGDMGYATDRQVLYRWNGASWAPITVYSGTGASGDIPTATDLPDGSLYSETDTGKVKQVSAGAWVTIVNPSTGWTTVIKAANETVNNSNSLQDDDDLVFPVSANSIYILFINLLVTTTATLKIGATVPADTTAKGDTIQSATKTSDLTSGLSGYASGIHRFMFHVCTGANSGNFQLRWAQITATASNSTILKGSILEYLKVG
ncbi:hypothetical protein [Dehalococcoides mccartyi]|uniref:Uncharacterized protein n=1 Tax=Dehalococcoides mccartyi (strain CBDB1) TaxID=255470 RepID=A0A916P4B2_DEHMC|nr:hypothetical protein [Dehalococcoides mccartyi]CAI82860.1 hypothetical protein cbdbA697 [Dehalococcoides mccartyi CBDB1]